MLYLKPIDFDNIDKVWEYVTKIPKDENSFINEYYGISKEDFEINALPQMINYSKGIDLPEGYVPVTYFFLWQEKLCQNGTTEKEVVGQFRVRHHLTPALAEGAGHIGYHIRADFRGKGFGTEGLRLAIIEAKKILAQYGEKELYLRCDISNPASLGCMLKNGATIHHQDEKKYYTRIKLD